MMAVVVLLLLLLLLLVLHGPVIGGAGIFSGRTCQ
jgi:hypothetical protein